MSQCSNMQKLTAKQATEKAICTVCSRRFKCDFNGYEHSRLRDLSCGGCALRNAIIREWMNDMMGFEK